jgi:hypothetical protein
MVAERRGRLKKGHAWMKKLVSLASMLFAIMLRLG